MKETLIRSLTGVLFVSAIILSLLLHFWIFLALFTLICILSWIEYVNLFPARARESLKVSGAVLTGSLFISVFFIISNRVDPLILLVPLFILIVLLLRDQVNHIQAWKLRIFMLISGIIYLVVPLSMLHVMAYSLDPGEVYSSRWILYTFIFLWTYDTMAYVSGRLTGRHTVWQRVSPGKTWEGILGGLVFVMALSFIMAQFVQDLSTMEWCFFGLVSSATGTMGDFLESWMKRSAGLKDSGNILPGHGGMLDRIDSLLLSVPFLTLYLYLVL